MNVLNHRYKIFLNYQGFGLFVIIIKLLLMKAYAEEINLTISAASNPDLSSDTLYREFKQKMNDSSPNFNVKLMVRGEGGSDEQNFYAVRRGRIQMGGVSYGAVSTVVPELAVLNAPFLFDSYEEMDFVLSSGLEDQINSMFALKGLIGLRHIAASWHIVYGKEPIVIPADAINIRMRSRIEASSYLFLQSLGADVIHVTGTEVITSLQTGLIDAGETNSFVYLLNGFYTEAPHLTMTRHVPSVTVIIANKKWWDGLNKQEKDAVSDALAPLEIWTKGMRADENRLIRDYVSRGMILHELNLDVKNVWRKKAFSSHELILSEIGGQARIIYDLIIRLKQQYALKSFD